MEEYSVVVLLQTILSDALERGCSDVHLYTVGDALVVQFRTGSTLVPYLHVDGPGPSMLRRVKALAKMDVAESRLPQDGAFQWVTESLQASIRVSTLPTVGGEAMVLRILPSKREQLDFGALGMTKGQSQTLHTLLQSSTGLLLVAGPTSSGKTTTLYAMMSQLARLGRRVVSIEDPVEQVMEDCHQLEVHERIGVTFEVGLRALLRQDPDVIMVGEIRDAVTAKTAVQAALTGHLVLSTTHASDLVGAVARLVDLGLHPSMVSEALAAVIVQDLCFAVPPSTGRHDEKLPVAVLRERVGVFEIHLMTPELSMLFASGMSWSAIRMRIGSGLTGERERHERP